MILAAAADTVVGRVHRGTARYIRVYRSIEHKDLKTICDMIKRPALPVNWNTHAPSGGFVPAIRRFAETVPWSQDLRHTADYDPGPRFHINDARSALQIARSAQEDWRAASVEQRDFFPWLLLFRPRA